MLESAELIEPNKLGLAQADPWISHSTNDIFCVTTLGNASSTTIDLPIVSLVKISLIPTTIAAFILLLSLWDSDAVSGSYAILAAFSFILSTLVFGEVRFYRQSGSFPFFLAFYNTLGDWLIVTIALGLLAYFTELYVYFPQQVLVAWFALTPFVLLGSQIFARATIRYLVRSTPSPRVAVIVGATPLSVALSRKVKEDPFLGIRVAGFFDDRQIERLPGGAQMERLGPLSDLPEYVKQNSVAVIYLCLPIVWHTRITKLLDDLRDTTASIYFVPDIFMLDLIQARIDTITGIPTIAIRHTPFYGFRGFVKRSTDIAFSSLILLLTGPVFLAIAAEVKLTSPGPVIFKQTRYGLDGRKIVIYKFRTMRVCEDSETVAQAKRLDDRVTKFGRFLRRTSLDELPQLINVLQGSMSVVGPRPHAVSHNEMYRKVISGYMVRHKVKPGITGWAQVNGYRGETETMDKMRARVEYDLDYLRNWSLGLDIWIIIRSVGVVLSDKNAY